MQMISIVFLIFTAAILLAVWLCGRLVKQAQKRIAITKDIFLIASYLFVVYADVRFALVLLALTVVTWLCARDRRYTKWGIVAALVCLGFFKYTNFFLSTIGALFGKADMVALKLILPLGISFYAFSAISYLADVHKGKVTAAPLGDVALYLAFFPKITSGPIQRSDDFFRQINEQRQITWQNLSIGAQIFLFGMFKKLVLADRLSVFVNQVYETPLAFGSVTVFLAILAYSLQIYFDFSGYSDMAIGVARMLDIRLPRNFNLPYLSRNVTELWKRWHISLSSWLQEYLYISLGGNRKGILRTYGNLIATMVLGGIWHGPQWTYILWGLLHGAALAVHKLWAGWTGSAHRKHGFLANAAATLLTFAFTSLCWVFFRAESVSKALLILKQLFSFRSGVFHPYIWLFFALAVLAAGSLAAAYHGKPEQKTAVRPNQCPVDGFYPLLDLTKFTHLVIFFVFCGLLIGLAYTGGSPFIYGEY